MNSRLPPNSPEAEQGALGCMLLDPQQCVDQCIAQCPPESFYSLQNRAIAETLYAMNAERAPIDLLTLVNRLKTANQLEACGGVSYITELENATPSAYNLSYYLPILRSKLALRRLLQTCGELASRVYETPDAEAMALVGEAEAEILKISVGATEKENVSIKTLVRGAIDRLTEWHSGKPKTTGIPTGFHALDSLTGGLKPCGSYVLAGRPGAGKTTLGMNIAEHIGAIEKIPVGIFSLEMSAEELVMRMLCGSSKVNGRSAEKGHLSESDFRRLTTTSSSLGKSKIFIDDTPAISISQFKSRARRMYSRDGCRAFLIDYLQIMTGSHKGYGYNRQTEISEISAGIKALAKELKVPIVVLAQLNRDMEKDKDRKPRLSDLRESGAIEQDADFVGMLYQVDPEAEEGENSSVQIKLNVAKQRNGPIGEIPLTFVKAFTRFESHSKID